jgi:hypothetical protein
MRMLRGLFGPSKDEIWSQVAKEIGGRYDARAPLGAGVVRRRSGGWEITLDTYKTGSSTTHTYTRMRAPFLTRDGLTFAIEREGMISAFLKRFGQQDIEIGDPCFDKAFLVKGNDETKVRELLRDSRIQKLIQAQPEVRFRIRADAGVFNERFPDGVHELYFEMTGVVKEAERLKSLFALFSLTLERLVEIDAAYEGAPIPTTDTV